MSDTSTQPIEDGFPRRPGRPLKNQPPITSAMATKSITFNLPAYLVDQLNEIAQRELSSLSQVVRSAIMVELRRHGLGQLPTAGATGWRGGHVPEQANPTL